jgi:hypothetical protein
MTLEQFRSTLSSAKPPALLPPALVALWHDAKGDWEEAHRTAQDIEDANGAWVHAYLHRKEGDLANAGYWYRRAKKPEARDALDAEWERMVIVLLEEGQSR